MVKKSRVSASPRPASATPQSAAATFDDLPDAVVLNILLHLPLDKRLAVGALIQRRCARLLRGADAWREISFAGCYLAGDAQPLDDRLLLRLCVRAGASLRCLDLSDCNVNRTRVSTHGVLYALSGSAGCNLEQLFTRCAVSDEHESQSEHHVCFFDVDQALALREACPRLRDGSVAFRTGTCSAESVVSALGALRGRVALVVNKGLIDARNCYADLTTRLAARAEAEGECAILTGLRLYDATLNEEGAAALMRLLECAPRSAPLRSLALELTAVSDERGA